MLFFGKPHAANAFLRKKKYFEVVNYWEKWNEFFPMARKVDKIYRHRYTFLSDDTQGPRPWAVLLRVVRKN